MARNGCTATWLYRNLAAACNCAGTVTAPRRLSQRLTITDKASGLTAPSPTISPTDPVPRGLLTLCPAASSGPQGLYTAYIQPIYSLYTAYIQPIHSVYTAYTQPTHSLHTALRSPLDCLLPLRWREARVQQDLYSAMC